MNIEQMKAQAISRIDWTFSGYSDEIHGFKCEAEKTTYSGRVTCSFWFRESYKVPASVVAKLNF